MAQSQTTSWHYPQVGLLSAFPSFLFRILTVPWNKKLPI